MKNWRKNIPRKLPPSKNELKDSQNVLNQLNLRISEKEKNQVIEDERKRANTERIEANQNELITLAEKQADLSVDKTTCSTGGTAQCQCGRFAIQL